MENEFDMGATADAIGESLFGSGEFGPDPTPEVETPEVETPEVETPEVETPETEVETPETPETDPETPEVESSAAAPKTWRKEAAAEWAKLPPSVQAEIHKREEDMYKGLETYKQDAGIGTNFKNVITPHLEHLQKAGVNVYEEINGLMEYGRIMRFGTPQEKMDVLAGVAQEYGIDLLDLAEHSPTAHFVDPAVKALQKQVEELKSGRQQDETRQQAQLRAEAQARIDAFKADPKHEHFDIVEKEMSGLLQAGIASDLEDAYAKAVKLNPITAAKELARQTADAQRKSQEVVNKAKKLTSQNLKTNARPGSATTPLGSMDDTLLATLNDIKSR